MNVLRRRRTGQPKGSRIDPHGRRYACERAALALGNLTDDELANAVFLHGNEQPAMADLAAGKALAGIVYLTAAKERIRWLSRALVDATCKQPLQVGEVQGDAPVDVTDPWRGLYLPARMPAPSEYGDLTHPDIPLWPDDREDALDKLVHAQGFDFHIVAGDFTEAALEDADELYWQEMRAWNPEAPEGEWRLAWKGDTEDGPYAWFVRPMALRQEAVAPPAQGIDLVPRPMDTAPRDGTMVRLLVQFTEHATEDTDGPSWTIGANNGEHDGGDLWCFAGWCWTHDHFTEGKGTPVGWLPLIDRRAAGPTCARVHAQVASQWRTVLHPGRHAAPRRA